MLAADEIAKGQSFKQDQEMKDCSQPQVEAEVKVVEEDFEEVAIQECSEDEVDPSDDQANADEARDQIDEEMFGHLQ